MPRRRFDPNGELPLPAGWEMGSDFDGKVFYIDHNSQQTSWIDPRDRFTKPASFADCVGEELPYGWEQVFDPVIGVYFVDHVHQTNQLEDPRLQWRSEQEVMLQDYMSHAQDDLEAKKEIYEVRQERLVLAQEEVQHLDSSQTAQWKTSRTSLNSTSSGMSTYSTKFDPDLLKADVGLARRRVARLRQEVDQAQAEMQYAEQGLQTLQYVDEKMSAGGGQHVYNVEQAQQIMSRIQANQQSISAQHRHKQHLIQSLAKLKDNLNIGQSGSYPDVSHERLNTASQTDLSGEMYGVQTDNRLGEIIKMQLQYDEAYKQVSHLQQQLADIENQMDPAQAVSDKDRLLLIQEKEQLLRELRSITGRSADDMFVIAQRVAQLEHDLANAVQLSNIQIAERLKLNECKADILTKLSETTRLTTYLESQLKSLSASTLSMSSGSSRGSLGSLSASSKGSLASVSITDIYAPSQSIPEVNIVELHRRVEKLLQGHSVEGVVGVNAVVEGAIGGSGESLNGSSASVVGSNPVLSSTGSNSIKSLSTGSPLSASPPVSPYEVGPPPSYEQHLHLKRQQEPATAGGTRGSGASINTVIHEEPASLDILTEQISELTAFIAHPPYPGLSSASSANPQYPGVSSASTAHPPYPSVSSASTAHPPYPGVSSASPAHPPYPGISSASTAHPPYPGVSSASSAHPPYPGISSASTAHPPYPGVSSASTAHPQYPGISSASMAHAAQYHQTSPLGPPNTASVTSSLPDPSPPCANPSRATPCSLLAASTCRHPTVLETLSEASSNPPLSPISESSSGVGHNLSEANTRSVSAAVSDESVAGDSGVYEGTMKRSYDVDGIPDMSLESAQIQIKLRYDVSQGSLLIGMEQARNLFALGFPNTQCQVCLRVSLLPSLTKAVFSTQSSSSLNTPKFGEVFAVAVDKDKITCKTLQVYVWCVQTHTKWQHCLGSVQISLSSFNSALVSEAWYNVLSFRFMQTETGSEYKCLKDATLSSLPSSRNKDSIQCLLEDSSAQLQQFNINKPIYRFGQTGVVSGSSLKEESSDESTIISSQTSTLTRNQGPCELEEDEDNYEDHIIRDEGLEGRGSQIATDDDEEEEEEEEDAEIDQSTIKPSQTPMLHALLAEQAACGNLVDKPRPSTKASAPAQLSYTNVPSDSLKRDAETNTELSNPRHQPIIKRRSGSHAHESSTHSSASIPIRRSQTFSPVTKVLPEFACKLNRSDSDSSVGTIKFRRGPFQRDTTERRSMRAKRTTKVPLTKSQSFSAVERLPSRTSLDLELDLQASQARLRQLQEEISRLELLKRRMEEATSQGETEPQWLATNDQLQQYLAQTGSQVNAKKERRKGAGGLEEKAEKMLLKVLRESKRQHQNQQGPAGSRHFREKMTFFTNMNVNVPMIPIDSEADVEDNISNADVNYMQSAPSEGLTEVLPSSTCALPCDLMSSEQGLVSREAPDDPSRVPCGPLHHQMPVSVLSDTG